MKRIQLQNIYLKLGTAESEITYAKQRNYCVTLLVKGKRSRITKTSVKPFNGYFQINRNITLVKDQKTESNHRKIAGIFNNYSENVVKSLKILVISRSVYLNYIKGIIVKYRKHPSIAAINEGFPNKYCTFNIIGKKILLIRLRHLTKKRLPKILKYLSILKENAFFVGYLHVLFNEAIASSKFPSSLKLANITPVFKKSSKNRAVSIPPITLKYL